MGLCAEHNVSVSFLSEYGKFMARVSGRVNGNVLLRKAQYTLSDNLEACSTIARRIVTAKIANSRTLLLRSLRDHSTAVGANEIETTAKTLQHIIHSLKMPRPLDEVRGTEGDCAKRYFGVFDHLIVANKDAFKFNGRNRRPPLDPINALLSFLYTLLAHDISSACESVGLDPAVGFLHRDRPGRPSLALDLMEELRPVMADRVALSLINRKQLNKDDFKILESGAILLTDEARKTLLVTWQERKNEEIIHPFINEKIKIGLIPFVQALLLARYIRGDIDEYPAFIWK
jgi:CRISPR-associated protein Cas1